MEGGLRERKKAATRLALHRAALDLVAERGFDGVTVEAIADAAMVSRRTFSNYFSGKEEALLHGDRERVRRLLELVHDRPAGEGPWEALVHAAGELVAGNDTADPDWFARRRTLRRHPALAVAQVTAYATVERELAAEIARRTPGAARDGDAADPAPVPAADPGDADPDVVLRSRALAATFLTLLRVATEHWLDQHAEEPLADVVHRTLSLAEPAGAVDAARRA